MYQITCTIYHLPYTTYIYHAPCTMYHAPWCMVHGAWCMVHGRCTWNIVQVIWYMWNTTWSMIEHICMSIYVHFRLNVLATSRSEWRTHSFACPMMSTLVQQSGCCALRHGRHHWKSLRPALWNGIPTWRTIHRRRPKSLMLRRCGSRLMANGCMEHLDVCFGHHLV